MMQNFIQFLLHAKAHTYAAQGDQASAAPALLGSRQLEYREARICIDGDLEYLCTYAGTIERFHGWEEIRCAGKTLFALQFSGGVLE